MYRDKKIAAVITARGGSKGIPGKNIKELHGRPLIAWTIDSANRSTLLDACVVSTDDDEIAAVATAAGGRVPFRRPPELSTDTAKSIPVIQHALLWMQDNEAKHFDYVMILQPTSPFRTAEDIDACIRLAVDTGADSVMSMMELVDFSVAKLKVLDADGRIFPLAEAEGGQSKRRDELPKVYKRNCAVYLTKVERVMADDLFGQDSRAYVMPPDRSVDINTPFDFELAQVLAARFLL